jgi:hypothetical protein
VASETKPAQAGFSLSADKEKPCLLQNLALCYKLLQKFQKIRRRWIFGLCRSTPKEKYMFIVLVYRNGRQTRLVFTNKIEQQAAAALLGRFTLVVN